MKNGKRKQKPVSVEMENLNCFAANNIFLICNQFLLLCSVVLSRTKIALPAVLSSFPAVTRGAPCSDKNTSLERTDPTGWGLGPIGWTGLEGRGRDQRPRLVTGLATSGADTEIRGGPVTGGQGARDMVSGAQLRDPGAHSLSIFGATSQDDGGSLSTCIQSKASQWIPFGLYY